MAAIAYELLDAPVIHGRADEIAFETGLTYATLLERVAALAGALRNIGVVADDRVGVELAHPHRVIAALAVARIGAVPGGGAEIRFVDSEDGPVMHFDGRVLAWDLVLRAGRNDPAEAIASDPPGLAEIVRTYLPA
ncbi:hypothetical protein BH09ACT10_BH09ACT10_18500 [soil metagenome]